MSRLITLVLFTLSTLSYGQTYNFLPNWKKGDSKEISITTIEKEFEDDILISENTTHNEAIVKVLKETKDTYTLEIKLENQALTVLIELYDKIGEELNEYKDITLLYSVNKATAERDLLNWKEAQKFVLESFKDIMKVLEEKEPDVSPLIGLVFIPIEDSFKSKENIEAFMETNIGYIFMPFNQSFRIGETISTTDTQENPFNTMQEISATTHLTLESLDEKTETCIIHQEVELDLTEFIEMMKSMMERMGKMMGEKYGATDSIVAAKNEEMDDFEMDIENLQVITFNYETSWVNSVESTVVVSGTDPAKGIKTRKEVITSTLVK